MDCLLIPGFVGFERHFCLCVCADLVDDLGVHKWKLMRDGRLSVVMTDPIVGETWLQCLCICHPEAQP